MGNHVREIGGKVDRVQDRIEDVNGRVEEVAVIQNEVGVVRGLVERLEACNDQNAQRVAQLRGDTNRLAVGMAQSVRTALDDGLGALTGNVNRALQNRFLGMGPQVQPVQVAPLPGNWPALQQ